MLVDPVDGPGDKKYLLKHHDYPVEVFDDSRCTLGEGPAWDADSQLLFWVDIQGDRVFAATADGEVKSSWIVPAQPSAAIPASPGKLIISAGQELLLLCTESGELEHVTDLSGEPKDNRCNDAKCDPIGNLWIGTMDNNERNSTGRLWRISPDGGKTVVLGGIGVANTLAWDSLRGRFYFADSMAGDIYVFDYDAATAEISCRRTFFAKDSAPGIPDGSAIDVEGFLWNARWDGSCVVRISPDGELDRVIEVPTRRPTSCAFGGGDMKTLFITSAAVESSSSPVSDDHSGAVFRVKVDVAGSVIPHYHGQIGSAAAC